MTPGTRVPWVVIRFGADVPGDTYRLACERCGAATDVPCPAPISTERLAAKVRTFAKQHNACVDAHAVRQWGDDCRDPAMSGALDGCAESGGWQMVADAPGNFDPSDPPLSVHEETNAHPDEILENAPLSAIRHCGRDGWWCHGTCERHGQCMYASS